MNKDFPCKVCTHSATQHYANVTKEENICMDCIRAEGSRSCYDSNEYTHEFIGDNCKYLELLDKRKEIKNENIG